MLVLASHLLVVLHIFGTEALEHLTVGLAVELELSEGHHRKRIELSEVLGVAVLVALLNSIINVFN